MSELFLVELRYWSDRLFSSSNIKGFLGLSILMSKLLRLFLAVTLLLCSLDVPKVFAQTQTDCAQTDDNGDCKDVGEALPVSDCALISEDGVCQEVQPLLVETDSVAVTVDSLREELAKTQIALLSELTRSDSTDDLSTLFYEGFVGELREELRNVVLEQSLISGAVNLAVHQASIRFLVEKIAAYEAAYGRNDGVFTTPYNVLTDAELEEWQETLENRRRGILTEAAPGVDIEPRTLGQITQITREIEAIRSEHASRADGPPQLVSLNDTPTATDPEAAAANIEQVDTPENRERHLSLTLHIQEIWNSRDEALRLVQQNIHDESFVTQGQNGKMGQGSSLWGRDPPPNITSPDGGGVASAIKEMRESIAAEVEAIKRRDLLGRAEAAARWRVASQWLNELVGEQESGWSAALTGLSESDLRQNRDSLQEFRDSLAWNSSDVSLPNWQSVLEIHLVDTRLAMLKHQIESRGPPPPGSEELLLQGPQAMQRAVELAFAAGSQLSFEEYAQQALDSRRLIELQMLGTMADTADSAVIQAREAQIRQTLSSRSETLAETYADAAKGEQIAFIHGRGREGIYVAIFYRSVQSLLDDAGDVLRQQVNSLEMGGLIESHVVNSVTEGTPPKSTATNRTVSTTPFNDPSVLVKMETPFLPQSYVVVASTRVPFAQAAEQLLFDYRYTETGANSAEAFRLDPVLAPGGVIVDIALPDPYSEQLMGIRYSSIEKQFELRIDGSWLPIDVSISPQTARAALGFVFDKRVAVVDIGSFGKDTENWMVRQDIIPDISKLSNKEKESLKKLKDVLYVVRTNPAIANTEIAYSLIAADELIFSALRLEPILLAEHTVWSGINTIELHQLLKQDQADFPSQPTGYKSVLTVENIIATRDEKGLHLHPQFDYAVYAGETKLERVSAWFNARDDMLRNNSPELKRLEEFSIAVAVIRTALQNGLDDGLDSLAYIYEPGRPSPSLICRSDTLIECEESFIQNLINIDLN